MDAVVGMMNNLSIIPGAIHPGADHKHVRNLTGRVRGRSFSAEAASNLLHRLYVRQGQCLLYALCREDATVCADVVAAIRDDQAGVAACSAKDETCPLRHPGAANLFIG